MWMGVFSLWVGQQTSHPKCKHQKLSPEALNPKPKTPKPQTPILEPKNLKAETTKPPTHQTLVSFGIQTPKMIAHLPSKNSVQSKNCSAKSWPPTVLFFVPPCFVPSFFVEFVLFSFSLCFSMFPFSCLFRFFSFSVLSSFLLHQFDFLCLFLWLQLGGTGVRASQIDFPQQGRSQNQASVWPFFLVFGLPFSLCSNYILKIFMFSFLFHLFVFLFIFRVCIIPFPFPFRFSFSMFSIYISWALKPKP